jgi:cell wall-associated NlpC family hydrolase
MERSSFLSLLLWLCLPITRFINRINWRFGRPFSCTYQQIDPFREHLQPGVVILTHKKYEFSTLFIPGYWTHSALVVSQGLIVEATGKGVCMNTLESFFSTVDDFIVLKPRFCCQDTMKKAGEQASTLVGYPFSFDFRTSNEMFYCSGLICWVYTQTLRERENPMNVPFVLQDFLNGNIIKPMDLYSHRDAWQVID